MYPLTYSRKKNSLGIHPGATEDVSELLAAQYGFKDFLLKLLPSPLL